MCIRVEVFWVVTPCSVVVGRTSKSHTASQPRRPWRETQTP